jgi:hypothetical protein
MSHRLAGCHLPAAFRRVPACWSLQILTAGAAAFACSFDKAALRRRTQLRGRPKQAPLRQPARPGTHFAHEYFDVGDIVGLEVTHDDPPPLALARLKRNLIAGCSELATCNARISTWYGEHTCSRWRRRGQIEGLPHALGSPLRDRGRPILDRLLGPVLKCPEEHDVENRHTNKPSTEPHDTTTEKTAQQPPVRVHFAPSFGRCSSITRGTDSSAWTRRMSARAFRARYVQPPGPPLDRGERPEQGRSHAGFPALTDASFRRTSSSQMSICDHHAP